MRLHTCGHDPRSVKHAATRGSDPLAQQSRNASPSGPKLATDDDGKMTSSSASTFHRNSCRARVAIAMHDAASPAAAAALPGSGSAEFGSA